MSQDDPMSDTNGNAPQVDPELLSAFYDGETSAEERASIEQLMDVSPETLQILDDYDQLSQDLRELHQAAPSPDLRDQVMARVGAIPVPGNPVSVPASLGRKRIFSIAASLAVAATLLVAVWPSGPMSRVRNLDQSVAANEAAEQLVADLGDASLADAAKLQTDAERAPASLAAGAAADMRTASVDELEEGIDSALSLTALAGKRPALEPGDVITYLQGNAEEITWVAVTVVDVQSAGNQVQLLLSQHGVEPPTREKALQQEQPPAEDRVLILVEADWNQLGAVIVDLNDQGFVHAMKVDAPAEGGAPAPLQGFRMVRDAESGEAESNKDLGPLRQPAQSLAGRDAAASPGFGEATEAETAGAPSLSAIQVPAAVPPVEWQRLAARRDAQLTEPTGRAAEPATASPKPTDEPNPAASIGRPLASRREKLVFIIQDSSE